MAVNTLVVDETAFYFKYVIIFSFLLSKLRCCILSSMYQISLFTPHIKVTTSTLSFHVSKYIPSFILLFFFSVNATENILLEINYLGA